MAELEGFICPLCMQSLPGVVQLEEHVREEHNDSATGRMKSNFKQLIGKAKISLSIKSEESAVSEGAAAVGKPKGGTTDNSSTMDDLEIIRVTNVSGIDPIYWPPQEPGHSRNLMGQFRATRDVGVQRIAVETNRLLVRLEKLLRLLKNEHSMKSKQLKSREQDIVPWKKDSDQKRCMKCRREFNVRRRRHHCRLCGDIICKKCSGFFPFTEAYQLMSGRPDCESLIPPPGAQPHQSKKKKLKKFLKDSDDEEELEDSSEEMRVCEDCEELLVRRLARMQSARKRVVSGLYDRMVELMIKCDKLKDPYMEMAESLLNGEFRHNLQDAQEKRQVLIQLYEGIDKLSKQVLNLSGEGGKEPSPANLKLQKSVRIYASNYLQDNLLTLPALPTRIQLRKIREAKEKEAEELRLNLIRQKEEQRMMEEAAAASAAIALKKDKTEQPSLRYMLDATFKDTLGAGLMKMVGKETPSPSSSVGWSAAPVISDTLGDDIDPFELQRQQLLSYIEQAREAKKYDELQALEESLAQIESMMDSNITI